jgi:hypothetical protein
MKSLVDVGASVKCANDNDRLPGRTETTREELRNPHVKTH